MSPRIQPGSIPPHYALTDKTRMELQILFDAMATVSELAGHPIEGPGPDLEPKHYAPLFATLSLYGKRILSDAPFIGSNGRVVYEGDGTE